MQGESMPHKPTASSEQEQDVRDQAADAARKTTDAINEAAQRAKQRAREFGQIAADKLDEQRSTAAEALHGASSSLRENAASLPGDRMPAMAHTAAEKLGAAAGYVETHDTGEILQDLATLVKRHPGPAVLASIGIGFWIGLTLRKR
jgi:hypothetical protein